MSLANKVTTALYNLVSLIVKIILLSLALVSSALAPEKTQYSLNVSFNFIFQLINDISSNLEKLLKYFNGRGIGIIAILKFLFASSISIFPNNLVLYLKELKLSLMAISALTLIVSSLEQNYKFPIISE